MLLESYHRLYITVQAEGIGLFSSPSRTIKLKCPVCEKEEYWRPLCPDCIIRMRELIKKGDNTLRAPAGL